MCPWEQRLPWHGTLLLCWYKPTNRAIDLLPTSQPLLHVCTLVEIYFAWYNHWGIAQSRFKIAMADGVTQVYHLDIYGILPKLSSAIWFTGKDDLKEVSHDILIMICSFRTYKTDLHMKNWFAQRDEGNARQVMLGFNITVADVERIICRINRQFWNHHIFCPLENA